MLRIGTCSWKYSSWAGLVYATPDPENFLAEYAQRYRTVEIDQWFWSLFGPDTIALPRPDTVAEYVAATDDDFRFTIKAPNSITLTHIYGKAKKHAGEPNGHFLSRDLVDQFLESIAPMQRRTDAIMFQFEYLNRQKVENMTAFLERLEAFLDALPDGWPFAVELRNPNFIKRPYFEMLHRQGVVHVFSEGYYMPSIVDMFRHYGELLIPRSVLRLLGTERQEMDAASGKRWDRRLAPKEEELARIAQMVNHMLESSFDVTVNVNNHYEGSAPKTIEALAKYLA